VGEPIRVRIRGASADSRRAPARPGKRALLAVAVLFVITLVAAQACQQAQVRVTKERAIAAARPEAGFTPERTQIRLVRQGLNSHPFWAISFSIPAASGDGYARLTTVRVDANTGKIAAVNREG
jgi:hypothetical protein